MKILGGTQGRLKRTDCDSVIYREFKSHPSNQMTQQTKDDIWEDSEDTPCAVCDKTPCYYLVAEEAVCSFECGMKILCGSIKQIVPITNSQK